MFKRLLLTILTLGGIGCGGTSPTPSRPDTASETSVPLPPEVEFDPVTAAGLSRPPVKKP